MDSTSVHVESELDAALAKKHQQNLEFKVWNEVASSLKQLDADAQQKVLKSVVTFLQIDVGDKASPTIIYDNSIRHAPSSDVPSFSEDKSISAKDFLRDKKPATDVDRVACLAYYLTHYQNTPHFKTLDISKLNTDAAQIKFSNAANAVDNAYKIGLIVTATKGTKQISAAGETYVQALPDRAAARAALDEFKNRRRLKRVSNAQT